MNNLKFRLAVLAVSFFLATLVACSSSNDFKKGKEQLETQGYTDIENTGHSFFCCSDEDTYSTGFKAKDKNGKEVKGCFCSENFKGITIRFK